MAALSLPFFATSVSANNEQFECFELTISNIKSIYEKRESILVKNPYIEGVCTGISFSEDDDYDFDGYFRSIGFSDNKLNKLKGDHQHVASALTDGGHVVQLLVYVTDGERGKKVSALFGETSDDDIAKRNELMFYHEVSHMVKESLEKWGTYDSKTLETMADISALHIYASANNLSLDEFQDEATHLFRDRKRNIKRRGYNWCRTDLWMSFLDDIKNMQEVKANSLTGIYDYVFGKKDYVDTKPKDLVGIFSSFFTE